MIHLFDDRLGVSDQEPQRGLGIEVPQGLSGLLRDPSLGEVGGDASQMDAMISDLDEEEHIQSFQPDCFNRKEIASQKQVFVMSKEHPPANVTVANRHRLDVVSFEDVPNSSLGSFTAQLTKLALDLAIAPTGILLGQGENQAFECPLGAWSAASVLGNKGPLAAYQCAMPAKRGFGFEQAQDRVQLIGRLVGHLFQLDGEHREQHFLGPVGLDGFVLLSKQDFQLLAKDEDLNDFFLFGKTNDSDEGNQKRESLRQDKPTHISSSPGRMRRYSTRELISQLDDVRSGCLFHFEARMRFPNPMGYSLSLTVVLLFSSGEEQGTLGVQSYLSALSQEELSSSTYVVNIDMVGYDKSGEGLMELWYGDDPPSTALAQMMSETIKTYHLDLVVPATSLVHRVLQ